MCHQHKPKRCSPSRAPGPKAGSPVHAPLVCTLLPAEPVTVVPFPCITHTCHTHTFPSCLFLPVSVTHVRDLGPTPLLAHLLFPSSLSLSLSFPAPFPLLTHFFVYLAVCVYAPYPFMSQHTPCSHILLLSLTHSTPFQLFRSSPLFNKTQRR